MLKYKQEAGKQSWQEVSGMKINEVSKMYDITADTLRYYERIGLIRLSTVMKAVFATILKQTATG